MSFLKSGIAAALAAAFAAAPAFAAPIPVASFDLFGSVQANGGATFEQATSLDFGYATNPITFGTPGGNVEMAGAISAVYTALGFTVGTIGTVRDIATLSAGVKNLIGFYPFASGNNRLSFDLGSITLVDRMAGDGNSISPTINVFGTGTVNLTGYDPTPGIFSIATSNTGAGLSAMFQSSVNTGVPVPEPASMALLGLGLAGLVMARRHKA